MVHRDIKPANLMLSHMKNRAVIKVLDFGLSKAASEQNAEELGITVAVLPMDFGEHLTCTGEMLGTPDFIAPEQIVDSQKADIRADIYSLGCTLYYQVSGHPPYPNRIVQDVLKAHRSLDARPLEEVRAEVPAELSALVARMMAKEPASRFQEPAEVAEALSPYFKKRSVALGAPNLGASQSMQSDRMLGSAETIQAATDAPAAPAAGSQGEATRPESTRADLIALKESEDDSALVATVPQRGFSFKRPRWLWLAGAGALAFTAVLLGVIVTYHLRLRRATPPPLASVAEPKTEQPPP
jgi:serine/threonine protein kinase